VLGWERAGFLFATGPWRAPASNLNTFARESHIDIMAAKLGMDPLEFRLKNLKDGRMEKVLGAAAAKFGWKASRTPSGRGFGLACATDAGAYVATMVEVEVDRKSGAVRVKRIVHAQEMGLVIHPEGVRQQMEGALTMGLGSGENIRRKLIRRRLTWQSSRWQLLKRQPHNPGRYSPWYRECRDSRSVRYHSSP
jgi:CO/xanthine dehydrogenase Mo-binding subunit